MFTIYYRDIGTSYNKVSDNNFVCLNLFNNLKNPKKIFWRKAYAYRQKFTFMVLGHSWYTSCSFMNSASRQAMLNFGTLIGINVETSLLFIFRNIVEKHNKEYTENKMCFGMIES